jgi:hypothetical protein
MRLKGAVSWSLSLLLLGASIACSACSSNTEGKEDAGQSPPPSGAVETNVVKGRVVDSTGKPLAGAQVVADNQLLYDANVEGVTGADGTYRLELGRAATTWNVSARFQRQYNGQTYTFDLHPSNPNSFATNEGAIRDFAWRLTGPRAEGGTYGGMVLFDLTVYVDAEDPNTPLARENVELTLTPEGPLVDGSTGAPLTARGTNSGDGFGLQDVAIGRYTVTARYAPQGKPARPMVLRLNNGDTYASSLTTDFKTVASTVNRIDLQLKFP